MVGASGGGDQVLSPPNPLASNALMSLLREGGQWDEVDDALTGQPGSGKKEGKAFDEMYKEGWEHPVSPRAPRAVSFRGITLKPYHDGAFVSDRAGRSLDSFR